MTYGEIQQALYDLYESCMREDIDINDYEVKTVVSTGAHPRGMVCGVQFFVDHSLETIFVYSTDESGTEGVFVRA